MTPALGPHPHLGAATLEEWLASLKGRGRIGELLDRDEAAQTSAGFVHTLREICQQPITWTETAARVSEHAGVIDSALRSGAHDGLGAVILTGSGSSLYAGECLALPLQQALRVPVSALPAGLLLTHPDGCLPPAGPFLVVSFGRSGDSPESRAVLDGLLEGRMLSHHLVITCNPNGALATAYR